MPEIIKLAQARNMKNQDILIIEKKNVRSLAIQHQLLFELVCFLLYKNIFN